jgi:TonB-linked SusC/RagA family outer membrane protein
MKFYFQTGYRRPAFIPKLLLVMKLTLVLLITTLLQVSAAATYGQKITFKGTNVSFEKFFQVIQGQTPYKVLYAEEMMQGTKNADVELNNASVEDALDAYFKNKPLTYTINNNVIVIKSKDGAIVPKAIQQAITITGKVTDEHNNALPGVNVMLKGTNTGTTTGSDGTYQLKLNENAGTLVFTYIGFTTREFQFSLSGNSVINMQLKEESLNVDEVVVVAYGTQRKTSLSSAVSAVKGAELSKAPVSNINNALSGRVAGISTRFNGGVPGQDDPQIFVRGVGTIGNAGALVVIDGIIRSNISQIDPNTIESVSVLKDAAAVAPYGLAGANGVILITTKHGKTGAASLSVGSYYGFQRPAYVPKMLNAQDYMTLKNEGNANQPSYVPGTPPEFAQDLINNYDKLHAEDPNRYPNSNGQRELVNMNTPQQNYNIQLSGGSDKIQYFVGLNYFKQQGIYDPLNYQRFNYNANLDFKATATTKITVALNNSVEMNQYNPNPQGISYIPTKAIYFSNGLWGESGGYSPAADLKSGSYGRLNRSTGLNSITIDQQLPFVKGLSVKGTFGYDVTNQRNKDWSRPNYYYVYDAATKVFTKTLAGDGITTLSQSYGNNQTFTYQGVINYARTFGDHDIAFMAVAEARNGKGLSLGASRRGYSVDVDELNLGTSNRLNFDNNGSSNTSSQIGYVYKANYAFKNRYLIEATGRYDGHYFFAPGKQWVFFPAASAAWRVSEEPFIKNKFGWLDNLKIRGSIGKSGNLASGGAFQYLSKYNLYSNAYAFGTGSLVQGSVIPLEANPNITWESALKSDIGLDFSLWHGKLTFEADYFYEKRSNMLIPPSSTVPVEYGLSLAQENAGIMSNRGVEFVLGTNQRFSNGLQLGVTGNVSYAKNKLIKVFEEQATRNNPARSRTGKPFGTPFGYQALGLFTMADDKNGDGKINSADGYDITQFGELHPGDVKYADLNGDKKIDANDEVATGHPNYPEWTYGLNINASWKGFDVTLFFQGAANASINIQGYQTIPFRLNNTNTSYELFDNRWTPQNQNAKYPRVYSSNYTNNTTNSIDGNTFGVNASSFWMKDNDFVRLKTAVIGYTFPSALTQKFSIKTLRLYVSGQNIFTKSNLGFMDPETGFSQREEAYPIQKAFIFGLNVNF